MPLKSMLSISSSSTVQARFSPPILDECSILTVENGKVAEYRPDRVMQNSKNETIVVDFKFGKQKVEHHEQVRKYIGLLRSMGHHRVKGYLWYVYPNRIVEVIK